MVIINPIRKLIHAMTFRDWVIILLLGLNLFLLNTSKVKNDNLEILQQRISTLNESFRNDKPELIDRFQQSLEPSFYGKSELSLISVVPESSCLSCVIYAIEILNDFFSKYPENYRAFFLKQDDVTDSVPINSFDIEFDFEVLEELSSIFPKMDSLDSNNMMNPIFLLIDRNGFVQSIHESEKFNPDKTDIFFSRVESLMAIYYEDE